MFAEWQRAVGVVDTTSPPMTDPGGGSDFAGFYNHLGIPIADWGFGGESGVYHSQYDDFAWMSRFGDPDFAYHATAARIGAAMVLRLANADILPYDYVEFARTMQRYVPPIERALVAAEAGAGRRSGLRSAIGRMEREAASFAAARDSALATSTRRARASTRPTPRCATWSARSRGRRACARRPWYRNLIYVADENNGYANMSFPSVNEAIRADDERLAASELADLARRFDDATRALDAGAYVPCTHALSVDRPVRCLPRERGCG